MERRCTGGASRPLRSLLGRHITLVAVHDMLRPPASSPVHETPRLPSNPAAQGGQPAEAPLGELSGDLTAADL